MQSHIEHSFIYCALFFPYFFCYNALLKVHRRKIARMQKNMIPSKTKVACLTAYLVTLSTCSSS